MIMVRNSHHARILVFRSAVMMVPPTASLPQTHQVGGVTFLKRQRLNLHCCPLFFSILKSHRSYHVYAFVTFAQYLRSPIDVNTLRSNEQTCGLDARSSTQWWNEIFGNINSMTLMTLMTIPWMKANEEGDISLSLTELVPCNCSMDLVVGD
jgi:hypothetical protein